MGRILAGLTVIVALVGATAPVARGAEKPPSAADVAAAQKRANAAAGRLAKARGALAEAEREVAALEARTSATSEVVSSLEGEVRELAVRQYVEGGRQAQWVGTGNPGQAARGQAMLRYVTVGRTDAVEGYRVARLDLEESRAALEQRLAVQRSAVGELRRDEARIGAELARLAAAQRAHEARVAAQRAAAARAAAAKAAAGARTRRASRSAPTLPVPPPSPQVRGSGEWVCPVQGPRAFSNDWGQPRSGGRRHQGNDIMAPRGTPVVASVAGVVRPHNSRLGGISYYLKGDDGNTYFGTHLDRVSGASGRVAAGTVVGYVGSTGNASSSSPHLHFEIHPRGGSAVNPYPTLRRYC